MIKKDGSVTMVLASKKNGYATKITSVKMIIRMKKKAVIYTQVFISYDLI